MIFKSNKKTSLILSEINCEALLYSDKISIFIYIKTKPLQNKKKSYLRMTFKFIIERKNYFASK